MKHEFAENSESNNDEAGVQMAPLMEKMSLITQLKESNRSNRQLHSSQCFQDVPLVCHSQAKSHTQICEIEQRNQKPEKLTTQMLIFRFSNKLRSKSGNISQDSVQPKYLRLLNDLGSDDKGYIYKGKTIQRLITYSKQSKTATFDLKWHVLHLYSKVPILSPSSRINIFLDIIILILTLLQLILVPLKLTFNLEFQILTNVELILYTLFTLDAVRSIITGIYIDGNLVLDRIIILKQYFFQNLWMDTLTVYCFWIFQTNDLVKLLFLLRFQKVNQTLTKLELAVNLKHQNYITLIKSIFLMLFGTHLMSCFQNLIQEATNTEWQSQFPVTDDSLYNKYIHSLYWAVQTMVSVGYGDILPVTIIQKLYTNAIMFIGCCLFGYMMNSIGNILSLINENQKNYSKYQKMHDGYFSKKPITSDLLHRIKVYSEHSYLHLQSSTNMGSEILHLISSELQIEFQEQVNGRIVENNQFFPLYSQQLQMDVVHALQEMQYLPSDLIDSSTTTLYILDAGQIILMLNTAVIEKYDKPHSNINLDSFVTGIKQNGSFYSERHSSLFILQRDQFLAILQRFERDFELFCYQRDQILFNGNYMPISLSCSICKSNLHLIQKCPRLHFIFNRKRLQRQYCKQERLFYLRQKFKTKTLRKIQMNQVSALLFVEDHLHLYESGKTQEAEQVKVPSLDEPKISFRLLSPDHLQKSGDMKDAFLLKQYLSQDSSLALQLTSKMLIQTTLTNYSPLDSEKGIAQFVGEFDRMCIYTHYFKECNSDLVIAHYNKLRKKVQYPSQSIRQSLFKNSALTLKKLGSTDVANKREDIKHRQTLRLATPVGYGQKSPIKFGSMGRLKKTSPDSYVFGISLKNSQILP